MTESVFEYGWVSDEISYFKSGYPEYIDIVENNFSQHAEYYESGRIKVVDLLEKNNFMTRYSFDEKGGIISLNIRGNYFERIKYFQEKIKFPIFTDRLFADDLYAGNHLYLSGNSVDDEIFYRLASNNSLGNTFKLNIVRTSVSAVCLDIIKYYPGIKQIIMESDIISHRDQITYPFGIAL